MNLGTTPQNEERPGASTTPNINICNVSAPININASNNNSTTITSPIASPRSEATPVAPPPPSEPVIRRSHRGFNDIVKSEFCNWITSPDYDYKLRLSSLDRERLLHFLTDPDLPQRKGNKRDKFLRQQARKYWVYEAGKLLRKSKDGQQRLRVHPPAEDVFDIIATEHVDLGHFSRDKLCDAINEKYYGITQQEVEWILRRCTTCILDKNANVSAPIQAIEVNRTLERIQIDLVDMRSIPSGGKYHWILHIKDHWSKYSVLFALKNKKAESVAKKLEYFIRMFGAPEILQADNGKEFKGACYLLLKRCGIKIIHGKPRSPQT